MGAQSVLDIILRSKNQTGQGVNAAIGSLTELKSGIALAMGAYRQVEQAAKAAYEETIQRTLDLAGNVRELSRLTNASYEDASRLIQVADDVKISFEKMSSGLEFATRQGFDVSIGGLKNMADEYARIPVGAERARYAMERFGKFNGPELQQLLEIGRGGIDELNNAVEDSMVLGEEQIRQARELEIAMDNWEDSINAVKLALGIGLVPIVTDVIDALLNANDVIEEQNLEWTNALPLLQGAAAVYALIVGGLSGIDPAAQAAASGIDTLDERQKNAIAAAEAYAGQQQAAKDALDGVLASTTALTKQQLFQKAAEGMDPEGALKLGRAMGVINETTYFTLIALDDAKKKFDENGDGAVNAAEDVDGYVEAVLNLKAGIEELPESRKVRIIMEYIYSDKNSSGGGSSYHYNDGGSNKNTSTGSGKKSTTNSANDFHWGQAYGGDVSEGQGFMAGEYGPEWVRATADSTVIPNNQMGGTRLANYGTINLYPTNQEAYYQLLRDLRP